MLILRVFLDFVSVLAIIILLQICLFFLLITGNLDFEAILPTVFFKSDQIVSLRILNKLIFCLNQTIVRLERTATVVNVELMTVGGRWLDVNAASLDGSLFLIHVDSDLAFSLSISHSGHARLLLRPSIVKDLVHSFSPLFCFFFVPDLAFATGYLD